MSAARPRVMRVFISSTFRDMQGEREELVKRVFPEIRRRCEERGVVWGEVDLRWGVTDEQKAEEAVLPICLAEIERTRPYFIGMLGERYGWVPDEVPGMLAESEAWLVDDRGRSVTEMEILHGVLNDPSMADHAYFYLRDPQWSASLPSAERAAFVEDGEDGRRRLADLRTRVRSSGFPVRDYAEPRAIGELVRADLIALVDALFPAGAAASGFEQARGDQTANRARLLRATISRPDDLTAVDVAVDSDAPGVVVTGAVGCGVSTLLAAYAASREQAHPQELVIAHHIDAQRGTAGEAGLLRHVCGELAAAIDEPLPPGDLRAAFAVLLQRACATRRVTLVVDGLHLVEVAGGGIAWLAGTPPATFRLVAGTRPGVALAWLVERGFGRVDLQLLDGAARTAAATTFLAAFSKALDPPLLARLTGADHAASPRHLRTVLDELRQHGDHFTLTRLLERLLAAPDLAALVETVLDRFEVDYELDRPGLVGDVLGALAASRTGLTEAELVDLLGDGSRRPLSQLQLGAGGLIPDVGGRLRLGFEEVRRSASRRYLTDAAAMHRRLTTLFADAPAGPRALDELPWHLIDGGEHERLRALVADPAFIEAAHDNDPLLLPRLWARAEAATPLRAVETYAPLVGDAASRAASIVTPIVAALGGAELALRLRQAAVDELGRDDPKGNLPAALANLAAAEMSVGDLTAAARSLDVLEERLRRGASTPELEIALHQNRGVVERHRGNRAEALSSVERAAEIARRVGRPGDLQAAAGERAGILAELGRIPEALEATAVQLEAATASGDPAARMRALVTRAALLHQTQDIAGAARATAEGEHLARDLGDLDWLATALTMHVQLRHWENRLDLARAQIEELIVVRERLGQHDLAAQLRPLLAAAPAAPLQDDLARLRDLEQRAVALQGSGDYAGSIAVCIEQEEVARRSRSDRGLASALGNRAVCLFFLGRMDEALPLLEQQIELQRRIADPAALATALANSGELLGRVGRALDALGRLGEAEQLARGAGQAPFADQIAQLAEQIRRRG